MDTFPPPAPHSFHPQSTSIPNVDGSFIAPIIGNPVHGSAHTEPQVIFNYSAANANAVPLPAPGVGTNHPQYSEMISAAIEAMKERDGSSRRAIAKYIEQSFSGLPPNHDSLLSHHLKRLKNSGHLVMVKKSYMLPNSDSAPVPVPAVTQDPAQPTSLSPRGRGRPPKPKLDPSTQPINAPPVQTILQPMGQAFPMPAIHLNGQIPAPTNVQFNGQTVPQSDSQPVLVALGLVDEPNPSMAKKSPGRPKKVMSVGLAQSGGSGSIKRGRGRPPGSKGKFKRSPGRPRKPKSVLGVMGPKRGPGRPSKAEPKTMIIPYAAATNAPVIDGVDQSDAANASALPPRARGRPKKYLSGGVIGGILSSKRRGRPPKGAGINKVKKYSGRPLGRPKKNAVGSPAASDVLIAANGDLKRKLDYFQSKVKQAVEMLKPQLTHESPVTAIAAVQELEELATMDLGAPLREEVQHPMEQN